MQKTVIPEQDKAANLDIAKDSFRKELDRVRNNIFEKDFEASKQIHKLDSLTRAFQHDSSSITQGQISTRGCLSEGINLGREKNKELVNNATLNPIMYNQHQIHKENSSVSCLEATQKEFSTTSQSLRKKVDEFPKEARHLFQDLTTRRYSGCQNSIIVIDDDDYMLTEELENLFANQNKKESIAFFRTCFNYLKDSKIQPKFIGLLNHQKTILDSYQKISTERPNLAVIDMEIDNGLKDMVCSKINFNFEDWSEKFQKTEAASIERFSRNYNEDLCKVIVTCMTKSKIEFTKEIEDLNKILNNFRAFWEVNQFIVNPNTADSLYFREYERIIFEFWRFQIRVPDCEKILKYYFTSKRAHLKLKWFLLRFSQLEAERSRLFSPESTHTQTRDLIELLQGISLENATKISENYQSLCGNMKSEEFEKLSQLISATKRFKTIQEKLLSGKEELISKPLLQEQILRSAQILFFEGILALKGLSRRLFSNINAGTQVPVVPLTNPNKPLIHASKALRRTDSEEMEVIEVSSANTQISSNKRAAAWKLKTIELLESSDPSLVLLKECEEEYLKQKAKMVSIKDLQPVISQLTSFIEILTELQTFEQINWLQVIKESSFGVQVKKLKTLRQISASLNLQNTKVLQTIQKNIELHTTGEKLLQPADPAQKYQLNELENLAKKINPFVQPESELPNFLFKLGETIDQAKALKAVKEQLTISKLQEEILQTLSDYLQDVVTRKSFVRKSARLERYLDTIRNRLSTLKNGCLEFQAGAFDEIGKELAALRGVPYQILQAIYSKTIGNVVLNLEEEIQKERSPVILRRLVILVMTGSAILHIRRCSWKTLKRVGDLCNSDQFKSLMKETWLYRRLSEEYQKAARLVPALELVSKQIWIQEEKLKYSQNQKNIFGGSNSDYLKNLLKKIQTSRLAFGKIAKKIQEVLKNSAENETFNEVLRKKNEASKEGSDEEESGAEEGRMVEFEPEVGKKIKGNDGSQIGPQDSHFKKLDFAEQLARRIETDFGQPWLQRLEPYLSSIGELIREEEMTKPYTSQNHWIDIFNDLIKNKRVLLELLVEAKFNYEALQLLKKILKSTPSELEELDQHAQYRVNRTNRSDKNLLLIISSLVLGRFAIKSAPTAQ